MNTFTRFLLLLSFLAAAVFGQTRSNLRQAAPCPAGGDHMFAYVMGFLFLLSVLILVWRLRRDKQDDATIDTIASQLTINKTWAPEPSSNGEQRIYQKMMNNERRFSVKNGRIGLR